MEQITAGAIDYWQKRLPKAKFRTEKTEIIKITKPRMSAFERGLMRRDYMKRRGLYSAQIADAEKHRNAPFRFQRLLRCVSFVTGVNVSDIVGRSRSKNVVRARHTFIVLVCQEMHGKPDSALSYPMIGQRLDGRDHTTILHALEKYRDNSAFRSIADKIMIECLELEASGSIK